MRGGGASCSTWAPAGNLSRKDARDRQIERLPAGGKPEIVDRLLGADQSLGDLFNLPVMASASLRLIASSVIDWIFVSRFSISA